MSISPLLQKCVANPEGQLNLVQEAIAGGNSSPRTLRRAAWLAAILGNTKQAEQYLGQACEIKEDAGESWFAMGLLAIANGDHQRARHAFNAAVEALFPAGPTRHQMTDQIAAYDPSIDRFSIFRILYDSFQHDFCCFLIPIRIEKTERQSYAFCIARAYNYLLPTPASVALMKEEHAINGDSMWYWLCLGHFHWIALQRDEADQAYTRARTLAIEHGIIPYHFDCGAMVWLKRSIAEGLDDQDVQQSGAMTAADWSYRFGEGDETPALAIVLGCDMEYFVFFPKFLLSVVQAVRASGDGQKIAVHCHIVDPVPEQVAFLEHLIMTWPQRVPDVIVSYSFGSAVFKDASYYTCLRYLILPEVLKRYSCGAMALDIDSLFDLDFFKHVRNVTSFDVGLRMYNYSRDTNRQSGGEPWSIGAHPTYVSNSPIGRRFASFIRNYVSAAYDSSLSTNWTIDQCGIAQGYDLILRDAADCKILNFAYYETLYHLPHEFGGKQGLLDAGGQVTPANFQERLSSALGEQAQELAAG